MKKIWLWIKSLFNKSIVLIQKYIDPSIEAVQNLKLLIDSPVTDILTAIIPGNLDDKIAAVIRTALPIILQELNLAKNCANAGDANAIIQCALKEIATMTDTAQAATWHNIAVMLGGYLSDGKLSWFELISLTEVAFQKKYKNLSL